jgi:junctophilin
MWYNEDEEEEDLLFSPALMARRASESWINTPPIEVTVIGVATAGTTWSGHFWV